MDLKNILSMIMGLVLFLFGMNLMGEALEKRAGNKLKIILSKLTASKIKGLLLGLAVTAVIQSSSATTVMVVGFVNSGIMTLTQAISVIMGANIGTTVTAWILSLTGIDGGAWYIQRLKPSTFTPILAVVGIVLYMFVRGSAKKDTGLILLGFATLMFGMETMSSAVKPLANVPEFGQILTMFQNPILGVLAGAFVTAVIQSSSASVGILQALSATGKVTIGSAIPIIMGQNIGTCVTAMISSVGANKNAKRAAAVHLYFNIAGTVFSLAVFIILNKIFNFAIVNNGANELSIAVIHTLFNVICTFVLFPFAGQLEKLAVKTVGNSKNENDNIIMLDERFFATPAVAIQRCEDVVNDMAKVSVEAIKKSFALFEKYDDKEFESIVELERVVDTYEDNVGTYLVKLSATNLTPNNSREVTKLLHSIGDFERLSDHAVNLAESMREMSDKKLTFSDTAKRELGVMMEAVGEIVELASACFVQNNLEVASLVEPLEQVIDKLKATIKKGHIQRLQNEECTIEMGFVLSDLVSNLERVADHCSNIAGCVLELANNELSVHEYLHAIKEKGDDKTKYFNEKYEMFDKKYSLA